MSDVKLYRVKATGEIVQETPGKVGIQRFPPNSLWDAEDVGLLTPVVAVEPSRVLPEGLEVVDVSDRVPRDGGDGPLAVLKLPRPARDGQSMLAVYPSARVIFLCSNFCVYDDGDEHAYDLIPKPAEPRYRPFAGWEEAKHLFGQRVRRECREWLVHFVDDGAVGLSDGHAMKYVTCSELLRSATLMDGTPCGVREDG